MSQEPSAASSAAGSVAVTPGQTIGPFFGIGMPYDGDRELVPTGSAGSVRLHGSVLDGAANPVPDALIELWQPDAEGRIASRPGSLHRDGYTFTGWGRAATDNAGHYSFSTVPPGPTRPGAAAFFAVTVFARGVTNRLFTRAYLPGDAAALEADPLLAGLQPDARRTLIARPDTAGLRFDIVLQGEAETVFLAFPSR